MINQQKGMKGQFCQKHNQLISENQQDQTSCQVCISQQLGCDEFNQKLANILSKKNQQFDQQSLLLQQLVDNIITYQTNINKQLDTITQLIKEQIRIIDESSQEFQNLIEQSQNQQVLIIELEKKLNRRQEQNLQTKQVIGKLLHDFTQKYGNLNHNSQKQLQVEKEQYELIQIKEKENLCLAFAFNKDNTILAVGCDDEIVLYEFDNENIKNEIQRLNDHNSCTTCIYFMKNSNGFISGIRKTKILGCSIGNKGSYSFWRLYLDDQKGGFVIFKKWSQYNEILDKLKWNLESQNLELDYQMISLSLNEAENKLVSCNYRMLIIELQQQNNKWIQTQTIDRIGEGDRVCFTIGDQFVFQPKCKDYLEIYDYDNINKKFFKSHQVLAQSFSQSCYGQFPCQFIKQLNILQVKNGQCLNIFKIQQDGSYQLIQTIQFYDYMICGCLSEDGQFLVTWFFGPRQIQVRQLKHFE